MRFPIRFHQARNVGVHPNTVLDVWAGLWIDITDVTLDGLSEKHGSFASAIVALSDESIVELSCQ